MNWGVPAALFLSICAYLAPQIAAVFFAESILALGLSQNVQNFVVMAVVEALTVGCVALFVFAYSNRLLDIGLGKFHLKYIGLAAAAFAVYFCLTFAASTALERFVPDESQELGFSAPTQFEAVLVFMALVVLAPLAEELLFRGFMFTGLRKRLPFWAAAIIVSLVFGLAHLQLNVAIDVFLLSLFLCYLREKTNSLWPAISLHALKNGVAYLFIFVLGVGA